MKIVVISDSHNNLANLNHVMGFAKKINAGAIIHCGDWNTLESVETILSFGIPLYAVVGNADIADNIKNKFPEFLRFEIENKKIGITHIFNKHIEDLKTIDIIFVGHYHSQSENKYKRPNGDFYRIINPGALENGINFAVYDTDTDKVEFFND